MRRSVRRSHSTIGFLVLDVKEAKHLVPGPISAAIKESAAIRMNRPYQPAIYGKDSGGRAKALKVLKAFKVEAIATVPPQFRGKVRMLGEEEKLANDRKGQFILMSELYGADGKGGTVGKVEAAKQAATAAARAEIKAKLVAMGFDEKQIEEATAVSQVIAPTTDPRGGLIRRLWAWVRG